MPIERVLDASVAGAAFFVEEHSNAARQAMTRTSLIAPDFLPIEVASLACKKLKRGEIDEGAAQWAMDEVEVSVDRWHSSRMLLPVAFAIAKQGRISIYDALYLALAEATGAKVLTLDLRLETAAQALGRGDLIETVI